MFLLIPLSTPSSVQVQFPIYQHLNHLSTFAISLLKVVGMLVSLLMSNLSTSAFEAIRSYVAAKSDVTISVAYSNSFLVAQFGKSYTVLTLSLIWLFGSGL